MESSQLKLLKEQYGKFIGIHNQYKRANKKEKRKLQSEIETLQNRMVRDHELNKVDIYIYNSIRNGDYDWFKTDMENIIEALSNDLTKDKSPE